MRISAKERLVEQAAQRAKDKITAREAKAREQEIKAKEKEENQKGQQDQQGGGGGGAGQGLRTGGLRTGRLSDDAGFGNRPRVGSRGY